MLNKRTVVCVLVGMLPCFSWGQEWAVSSNVVGLADYGTLNAEAAYGFDQHWSVMAGVRYNPFSYADGDDAAGAIRKCQRSFSLGARYWPWHIYSGWWLSSLARYQEYNFSSRRKMDTSEGDRIGASLSAGYSYMISPWLNIELGLGFWGGYDRYRIYACPRCGVTLERGSKFFISPDEVILALSVIF